VINLLHIKFESVYSGIHWWYESRIFPASLQKALKRKKRFLLEISDQTGRLSVNIGGLMRLSLEHEKMTCSGS